MMDPDAVMSCLQRPEEWNPVLRQLAAPFTNERAASPELDMKQRYNEILRPLALIDIPGWPTHSVRGSTAALTRSNPEYPRHRMARFIGPALKCWSGCYAVLVICAPGDNRLILQNARLTRIRPARFSRSAYISCARKPNEKRCNGRTGCEPTQHCPHFSPGTPIHRGWQLQH